MEWRIGYLSLPLTPALPSRKQRATLVMALPGLKRAWAGFDVNCRAILQPVGDLLSPTQPPRILNQELHPPFLPFIPELSGTSFSRPPWLLG